MIDSMIERVARAIYSCAPNAHEAAYDDLPAWRRAGLERIARAAIAAMREPSDTIRTKSVELWDCPPELFDVEWAQLIDAALEGK